MKPPAIDRRSVTGALALLTLGFVAYLPALRGEYIWDDTAVWDNYLLEDLTGLWKLWTDPSLETNPYEEHYWPVTYTSFWIEARLWGLHPFSLHLVNILLHCLNCILLWRIILTLGLRGAWYAAALFAVHPAHVESVAWIVERKDLLSATFYFLAAMSFMKFAGLRGALSGRTTTAACSIILFVLAMLCKSVTFSLPLALALVLFWKRPPDGHARAWIALAVMLAVGCLIVRFDIAVVREHSSVRHTDLTPLDRINIAGRALWFYAGKVLWPMNLTTVYPRWDVAASTASGLIFPAAAGAALLAAAVSSLRHRRRREAGSGAFPAMLYFCITLGPTLGFIDYGYMIHSFVADRFQYLASAGLLIAMAAALHQFPPARNPRWREAAAACILVACTGLTLRQSALYRDLATLFTHAERHAPDNWLVQYNLGTGHLQRGDDLLAVEHLRKAIAIRPTYGEAHSNIAIALDRLGNRTAADHHRTIALNAAPDDPLRLANEALAAVRRGDYERAALLFARSLAARDDQEGVRVGYSVALSELGRPEEALEQARIEIAAADSPEARIAAASALTALNRRDEAAAELAAALRIDPDSGPAHLNLGILRLAAGRPFDALADFERARELMPESPSPPHQLAEASAMLGRREDVIRYERLALELAPDYYAALVGLGLGLIEAGRPEESLAPLARAAERRPDLAEPRLHAAEAHARLAQSAPARKHAEAAIRLEPGNPRAHMTLGTVLARAGLMNEAARAFEEAVRLDPSSAEARAFLERARRGSVD